MGAIYGNLLRMMSSCNRIAAFLRTHFNEFLSFTIIQFRRCRGELSFLLHSCTTDATTTTTSARCVINPHHSYKLYCWRNFPNPQINLTLCQMSYRLVSIRRHIAGRLKCFGNVIGKPHRCPERVTWARRRAKADATDAQGH